MADQEEAGNALLAREQVKALLQAAASGSVAQLLETARAGGLSELTSVKDGNGKTALHFAAQAGNTAVCTHLLEVVAMDPDIQDDAGNPP